MDLIVYQMVQLEVVHIADGDAVIELLAGAAVVDDALAVLVQRLLQPASRLISSSVAPSNTGVSTFQPSFLAAKPR